MQPWKGCVQTLSSAGCQPKLPPRSIVRLPPEYSSSQRIQPMTPMRIPMTRQVRCSLPGSSAGTDAVRKSSYRVWLSCLAVSSC
jgi:hypothetical protein